MFAKELLDSELPSPDRSRVRFSERPLLSELRRELDWLEALLPLEPLRLPPLDRFSRAEPPPRAALLLPRELEPPLLRPELPLLLLRLELLPLLLLLELELLLLLLELELELLLFELLSPPDFCPRTSAISAPAMKSTAAIATKVELDCLTDWSDMTSLLLHH